METFSENSTPDEMVRRVSELALSQRESALLELQRLLLFQYMSFGDPHISVSRLACRALLQKGHLGVSALVRSVTEASFQTGELVDVAAILEALWHAAHGHLPPKGFWLNDIGLLDPLETPLTNETISAARTQFQDIVEESQISEDLFFKLLMFLFQVGLPTSEDLKTSAEFMRGVIFEIFTEPAIKITKRIVDSFVVLINESQSEETYQRFLARHPVFIDPLASQVISKQKLGLEHVTDFVIRRLDNEYILVEIEKPSDPIFTSSNDFTAKFTHAYGQVLEFQEWVDAHTEYARSLLPGISSPKGILVIGLRSNLVIEQAAKLKRLNANSSFVEVVTYDDLLAKTRDLYSNIHRLREKTSDTEDCI